MYRQSEKLAATLRGSRWGCNPHRSLWCHWWRHNSETITDREKNGDHLAPWNPLSYPSVKTASLYTNLLGRIFATKACIDNQKELLNSIHAHVPQYGEHIWTGFASCLRYCSDVAHGRPTRLHDVWPSHRLIHYIYTFGGSCSLTEFCPVQNSLYIQVLHYPVLAVLLHGTPAAGVSQTLRRDTKNGITELLQRAPTYIRLVSTKFSGPRHEIMLREVLPEFCPPYVLHLACSVSVRQRRRDYGRMSRRKADTLNTNLASSFRLLHVEHSCLSACLQRQHLL